jgi:predicted alpha/beta superfamily hydrolase
MLPRAAGWLLLCCFLLIDSQAARSQPDCKPVVKGTLEIVPVASKVFGNTRSLRVWLPPDYGLPANARKTYPVLYLLDGQMLFGRCADGDPDRPEWHVDEALTDLIGKGGVAPLIVVGIDNTGPNRNHEFGAYPNPLSPADHDTTRAGDRFPDFLESDVMTLIGSKYRVAKGRENTGIGGSSLGAAAALYTLIHRPDLAGLGLLESTSLQIGNGQFIRDTAPLPVGPLRISIGVGAAEMGPEISKSLGLPGFDAGFAKLSEILAANMRAALFNHPEVKLTVQPGANHSAKFWGERFPAAVQFLFPPPGKEVH